MVAGLGVPIFRVITVIWICTVYKNLKVNGYIFRGSNSATFILPPISIGVNSYRREFASLGAIFLLGSIPHFGRTPSSRKQKGSCKKYGDVLIHLNPIVLRAVKTLWSYVRSECNWVNLVC